MAVVDEVDMDFGRCRAITPRLQILVSASTVTLEKSNPNGMGQRGFPGFVRAMKNIQTGVQVTDVQATAELTECMYAYGRQFHCCSCKISANNASASRATIASAVLD